MTTDAQIKEDIKDKTFIESIDKAQKDIDEGKLPLAEIREPLTKLLLSENNPSKNVKDDPITNNLAPNELRRLKGKYTLEDFMEDIGKTKEGFKTGYKKLDEYLAFEEGTNNLIAGRPSNGKTT